MQERYQNDNGTLYHYNRYSPHINAPVGTVTYRNGQTSVVDVGNFELNFLGFNSPDFTLWNTELGLNMYQGTKPLKRVTPQTLQQQQSNLTKAMLHTQQGDNIGASQVASKRSTVDWVQDDSLNTLIKGRAASSEADKKFQFTLDLFNAGPKPMASNQGSNKSQNAGNYDIDVGMIYQKPKHITNKADILKELETPEPVAQEQQDDLLDLMDKAM